MSKRAKIFLILGILLLIVAGYFGYTWYRHYQNRKLRDKILGGAIQNDTDNSNSLTVSTTGKTLAEIKALADKKGIAHLKDLADK